MTENKKEVKKQSKQSINKGKERFVADGKGMTIIPANQKKKENK